MHRMPTFWMLGVVTASCAATPSPAATPSQDAPVPVAVVEPGPAPVSAAPPAGAAAQQAEDDSDADVDDSEGAAPEGVLGVLTGDQIGEAFGTGGLGLSGTGISAGGTGEGLGLGTIGTIGHGSGPGGSDFGTGSGRIGGSRGPGPRILPGDPSAQGRLDRDIIRRIVARNRSRFAYCYERELAANPTLEGSLAVRFVIGTQGAVASATAEDVKLASPSAVACVVWTFQTMQFPKPDGGIVVVRYPFTFRLAEPASEQDGGAAPADAGTGG